MKKFWFFSAVLAFAELMFHLYKFGTFGTGALYGVLFAVPAGLLISALTSFGSRTVNIVLTWVLMSLCAIVFGLQIVYSHVFKVYIGFYSITQNAGDATEFWREALNGIVASIPALMLTSVIPLLAVGFAIKKHYVAEDVRGYVFESKIFAFLNKLSFKKLTAPVLTLVAAIATYLLSVLGLRICGTEVYTPYDLYHNSFMLDMGIEKLGVMTAFSLDLKELVFGAPSDSLDETGDVNLGSLNVDLSSSGLPVITPPEVIADAAITPVPTSTPAPSSAPDADATPTPTPLPTPSPTPTPVPIDTSPNVLDIDFEALAQSESDSEISDLHSYFATVEPTKRNEYTGMFKDYNFIYLTCEGFSPWAVDEKLTPTLYKLTHSGFVFKNFYNPIWYTSTSDGEYVECLGLLPYSTNSFKRSKNNALPFCFGWQFLKLGYTSRAYHAHTATYYGRNETHPNMGYIFKAKKAGLAITDVWPESDLEMMQLSVPEFINDDHFHVYYMTVSGHLEYNFYGNTQAYKHEADVAELPYSSACRAYIACNMELDLALKYLIDELEAAGKLDNTVIAFGGDHYPYGLTMDQINELAGHTVEENFELYGNYFVLWNSQIEEPIVVDKYCSSIDMMPTLSNLFGLEYDSRLFMGTDILSDSPALVMFSNQSFITDYCMYNSSTGEVTMLADVELPEGYISSVSKIVKKKFAVSKSVLLKDYYRYLMDFIPDVVTKVPDTYE